MGCTCKECWITQEKWKIFWIIRISLSEIYFLCDACYAVYIAGKMLSTIEEKEVA